MACSHALIRSGDLPLADTRISTSPGSKRFSICWEKISSKAMSFPNAVIFSTLEESDWMRNRRTPGVCTAFFPKVAGEVVRGARAAAVAGDENLPVVPVGLGQDVDRLLEFHGVQPGDRLGDHIGISL